MLVRQEFFRCPWCADRYLARPVRTAFEEGKPHDARGHALVYRRAVVLDCGACHRMSVECLSHDCFDFFDGWDRYGWFVLTREDSEVLRPVLRDLPYGGWDRGASRALAESCRLLPTEDWRGAVLPYFAEAGTLLRRARRAKLALTEVGFHVLIAAHDDPQG